MMESPPRSKKLSWIPMLLMLNASDQILARSDSIGVVGATNGVPRWARSSSGGGNFWRLTFPLLLSGKLNSNGKVNRQKLPPPELDRSHLGTPLVAPTTPMESLLAKIWSEALSINSIGIHDSFFDLGGDSIIASRIVSAIGRKLPWNLALAEFYDACTIAQGAQLLAQKAPDAEQAERVAALCLKIDGLSSAEVETMLIGERNKRRLDQPAS